MLEVRDLKKYYPIRRGVFGRVEGFIRAVDGVSFDLYEGETLGLVGESGCGKTTTGRTILRLVEPTGGRVRYRGQDITRLPARALRRLRREMQIIFQDPFGSLDPRMTAGQIVAEPLVVHGVPRRERERRVAELLERVGLTAQDARRLPHEFSGGQRQRLSIARALALRPRLVVCDEPVSALDVSIQSQILNLLMELQRDYGLTYLFIAHDLNVVRHVSDRVGVMYLGRLVELADADELYARPAHPYTQALLSAIPEPDPERRRERIVLRGDVPSPARPPSGCRFHTRCPLAQHRCRREEPAWRPIRPGHWVACHFAEEAMGQAS
ncbi:dipeptide ABC transporter ATP-binding protein [Thermaerobacter sp. FW80]|uniref:ABC transporter ATP-binding protein n=1 Tax=Thermaerobacter sp. FW80 TaxID=2546351 RepID=UPI001075722F|nr:dipeptide ABC transporter ATP-binding protein [Thermaerobacter sp. FW80]QBS38643.1 dipeptide ABC transporter ATP-binding protein [Thermaerobacter sp. FW80]